jgi:hypothetical protein
MTDQQIQEKYNQTIEDEITLDYPKWSFQQRQQKLPDDHGLWEQQRDAVLARRQRINEAARASHLADIEARRKDRQAEADAQIDLELEPKKQTLMREWLANNPNETAADFEKKAWHHLRTNLIEQRNNEVFEAEKQRQMSTGRYSL